MYLDREQLVFVNVMQRHLLDRDRAAVAQIERREHDAEASAANLRAKLLVTQIKGIKN